MPHDFLVVTVNTYIQPRRRGKVHLHRELQQNLINLLLQVQLILGIPRDNIISSVREPDRRGQAVGEQCGGTSALGLKCMGG